MLIIYTDGSASRNGAKDASGGFGVVVCEGEPGQKPEQYILTAAYSERATGTTNNREELKAIIYALEHYGAKKEDFFLPVVYSDSQYCVNTFTNWIKGWKANGWVRKKNQPIENLDLIQKYDSIINSNCQIDLRWVRGHADNIWNNIADALATGKMTPEEVIELYGNR